MGQQLECFYSGPLTWHIAIMPSLLPLSLRLPPSVYTGLYFCRLLCPSRMSSATLIWPHPEVLQLMPCWTYDVSKPCKHFTARRRKVLCVIFSLDSRNPLLHLSFLPGLSFLSLLVSRHLFSLSLISFPFLSFPFLSFPFLSFPLLSFPFLSFPFLVQSFPFFFLHLISGHFLNFYLISALLLSLFPPLPLIHPFFLPFISCHCPLCPLLFSSPMLSFLFP